MKKNKILISAVILILAVGNAAMSQSKNTDNTLNKKRDKTRMEITF